MSCGVGRRHGLDSALLWLWRRPVATAPIRPLAWEPPYAAGAAQEIAKRQKKKCDHRASSVDISWELWEMQNLSPTSHLQRQNLQDLMSDLILQERG